MSKITITVSGRVGSGKSAMCGEIEILCKALGLKVEWTGGQQEKNLTHADWTEALEMYKPEVTIIEHIERAPTAMALDGERAALQSIIDAGRNAKPRHEGGIGENTVYLTPDMYMALSQAPSLAFESALVELVNKIDTGLDSGDLLVDARRVSSAIDSILSGGDLVACAHEYFRDSGDRYEKSIEFRIGWDACLDAIVQARAASTQAKVCSTCNGHGMIGGPSYYAPDEGGEPCPDCVAAPQPAQSPDGRVIDKAMVKRLAVQHGLLPVQTERELTDEHLSDLQEAREILENMVRSVELDGNYSTEATCTFLRQALLCLPAAQPASGADHD